MKEIDNNTKERETKGRHTIGRFYMKCAFVCLPFILLIALYFINDPFMVLHRYTDYDHSYVEQNQGAVGWYKYKLYRNKVHYDSFIMGNSCTMSYTGKEWKKYINGTPFRFFSNSEKLPNMLEKLQALDRQPDQPINNLLLIIDNTTLKDQKQDNCFHIMPPEVSHVSQLKYQFTFLQGFFMPNFFCPYIEYCFTHHYKNSMHGVINEKGMSHLGIYNDAVNNAEDNIRLEGNKFWSNRKEWVKEVEESQPEEDKDQIDSLQYDILNRFKQICDKHHTNVKIVINPNPMHVKFNHQELYSLQKIFGCKNVFDFTRAGNYYSDIRHYCDKGHYRTELGNKIMEVVYHQPD